ncbi:uncharacterized protein METZ01_LOCUS168209 [marine metagenome]|uniref:Uncharacterized protein n=1 Tax=marine metagenome TaxID=408172 RepID=A0A382BNN6_9ZZZZ
MLHSLDKIPTKPRYSENQFNHKPPGGYYRDLRSEHGDNRQNSIAQLMPEEDPGG